MNTVAWDKSRLIFTDVTDVMIGTLGSFNFVAIMFEMIFWISSPTISGLLLFISVPLNLDVTKCFDDVADLYVVILLDCKTALVSGYYFSYGILFVLQ